MQREVEERSRCELKRRLSRRPNPLNECVDEVVKVCRSVVQEHEKPCATPAEINLQKQSRSRHSFANTRDPHASALSSTMKCEGRRRRRELLARSTAELVHPFPTTRDTDVSPFVNSGCAWGNMSSNSLTSPSSGSGASSAFFSSSSTSESSDDDGISKLSAYGARSLIVDTSHRMGSVGASKARIGTSDDKQADFGTMQRNGGGLSFDYAQALVSSVLAGLRAGVLPTPVDSVCTGGAYFLRTPSNRIAAVFKPVDEEPYAPNNPKAYRPGVALSSCAPDTGMVKEKAPFDSPVSVVHGPNGAHSVIRMKIGIAAGKGAVRECAAYLLDMSGSPPSFAGVPETCVVTLRNVAFRPLFPPPAVTQMKALHIGPAALDVSSKPAPPYETPPTPAPVVAVEKTGSLQEYVPHLCAAEDMGHCRFPVGEVHRIAIFDVRTFNTDRHSGNIIVSTKSTRAERAERSSARLGKQSMSDLGTGAAKSAGNREVAQRAVMAADVHALGGRAHFRRSQSLPEGMLCCARAENARVDGKTELSGVSGHESIALVPIDHSFCLPRYDALGDATLDWTRWEQAAMPLSGESLAYISRLDGEADAEMLRTTLGGEIDEGSLRTLRIGTMWLQEGAAAGLTLAQMGRAMCRPTGPGKSFGDEEEASIVEELVAQASAAEARAGCLSDCQSSVVFFDALQTAMREQIALELARETSSRKG